MLKRKAWCDSRNRPRAVNRTSGTVGVFQSEPSTWETTPYADEDPFAATWNALAAAWMHHVGRGGQWACA